MSAAELRLPEDLRTILDLANATPPEFHAYAILKVLQTNRVKPPLAQRQLIEQAYQLGASAHDRYPVHALSSVPMGSLSALRGAAGQLGLDALSLQTRAVQDMLPLDKAKARQMFADIPRPSPAPLTCDSDVAPVLGDYYQLLGRIAQETFTPKERQREDHVSFLLDYVGGITSPSQLVPVATMLQSLRLTDNQMHLLYAKLGSAMETVTPDDRSFADVTGALTPLLTSDLMPSLQRFITNHSSVARCEKPKDDVQATIAGGAASDLLNQTAEAKRIGQMAFNLRIRDSRVLSAEDRATPEWQQAFTAYVNALAEWQQPQGESDALFFHEKVAAWMQAADMAVVPDSRAYAIDEGVRVLANSPLQNTDPAEWFWQVIHAIPGRQPTTELLAGFERSGNPILSLYVALVRLPATVVQ